MWILDILGGVFVMDDGETYIPQPIFPMLLDGWHIVQKQHAYVEVSTPV